MACHCNDPKLDCEQRREQQGGKSLQPATDFTRSDGTVPPFLPQPSDFYAKTQKTSREENASRIGPWATGRPIWNPNVELVGVRPVVDRYDITKYSPLEWRKNNKTALDMVTEVDSDFRRLQSSIKCTIDRVAAMADKLQNDNSLRLQKRLQDVQTYQNQAEAIVKDLRDEIVLLTEYKVRVKLMLPALKMPESIAGECIDKRTCRTDPDLVKDEVDVELVNEMSMIYETRQLFLRILEQIEKQIETNRAVKDELEMSWSDQKETSEIEMRNACLRNNSPSISFKHGSTRVQSLQTSPEEWQHHCESLINLGLSERRKSQDLRQMLESEVLTHAIRDLQNQADKVWRLLKERIDVTDECRQAFEDQLRKVLKQIADAEANYDDLSKLRRQLDYNLKVVQTRLDTRMFRPRSENCRDEAQYGLMEEVREINQSQSALKSRVDDLDLTLAKLYQTRAALEFEVMTKRKSLYIDQQRCLALRERYPDLSSMTGSSSS